MNENERNQLLDEYYSRLKVKLAEKNIEVVDMRNIQYGIQILLYGNSSGNEMLLNIYRGRNDFSFTTDNKGSPMYLEVLDCVEQMRSDNIAPFDTYIGTDESGKGDYFGPLVISGFLTNPQINSVLFKAGIRDSKTLDDFKVMEYAGLLYDMFGKNIVVHSIQPCKYNELYSHFRLQGKNMNYLIAWGLARVIEKFLEKNNSIKGIVADQFGDVECVRKSLLDKGKKIELVLRTKAENDMAVAAASIIARYEFLKWISETSERYCMNIPKGASDEARHTALQIAKSKGIVELRNLVKVHFRNTKSVLLQKNIL